ncbi:MAG TPA: MarR family transcriptional regulator [Ktedonobacteraceae bacterium]
MQLEDTIGYWLSYAQRCFASAFFEVLQAHCITLEKPYVITPPQWGVLTLLSRRDRQTISTLAQQLGVDGPAVTNIVKRLEQSDLVERVRDREDERVVNVLLTVEGQDIFRSLAPLVVQFHEQVLPGNQRQVFLEQMHHLVAQVSIVAPRSEGRFSFLRDLLKQTESERENPQEESR